MKIKELQKASGDKIGRVNKNDVKPYPHEESTALFLAQYGFDIEFIMPRNTYKSSTPDILLQGGIWEMKSPIGGGSSTIARQFHYAGKQLTERMILDLRRVRLPAQKAQREAEIRLEKSSHIRRLFLITKDGKLLDIKR